VPPFALPATLALPACVEALPPALAPPPALPDPALAPGPTSGPLAGASLLQAGAAPTKPVKAAKIARFRIRKSGMRGLRQPW
jgi:hypothetical protein